LPPPLPATSDDSVLRMDVALVLVDPVASAEDRRLYDAALSAVLLPLQADEETRPPPSEVESLVQAAFCTSNDVHEEALERAEACAEFSLTMVLQQRLAWCVSEGTSRLPARAAAAAVRARVETCSC